MFLRLLNKGNPAEKSICTFGTTCVVLLYTLTHISAKYYLLIYMPITLHVF